MKRPDDAALMLIAAVGLLALFMTVGYACGRTLWP